MNKEVGRHGHVRRFITVIGLGLTLIHGQYSILWILSSPAATPHGPQSLKYHGAKRPHRTAAVMGRTVGKRLFGAFIDLLVLWRPVQSWPSGHSAVTLCVCDREGE